MSQNIDALALGDGKNAGRHYTWPQMLAAGVVLNLTALALGPTSSAKEQYAKSTKPPFAPPSWVFGIAWPINNLLTLWGNRHVLNAPASPDRTAYLRLQAATWALFLTYGIVRFRLDSPLLGYLNTTAFLAFSVASAARAARIDSKLLLSYATLFPWLVLATTLSVYQLQDPDPLFDT